MKKYHIMKGFTVMLLKYHIMKQKDEGVFQVDLRNSSIYNEPNM